jgi:methyl-accepting chemotaxis protein
VLDFGHKQRRCTLKHKKSKLRKKDEDMIKNNLIGMKNSLTEIGQKGNGLKSRMSLKLRLTLPILLIVFLVMASIVTFLSVSLMKTLKIEALSNAGEMAYRYANEVDAELEIAMDTARTLAHTFEAAKIQGSANRDLLNAVMKKTLERNPNFIGVWTCWEPNALDGKDSENANTPGHDATGRFIPYWNSGSGTAALEPLLDYDKTGAGDYYLLARNSGKETIVEPYVYKVNNKEVLMTSLVVPIVVENSIVGVAGVDVQLDRLQELVTRIKPYGTGVTAVFANQGTVAASFDPKRIGKQMREVEADMAGEHLKPFADAVKTGREYNFTVYASAMDSDLFIQTVPFSIGKAETPWAFAVGIPMKSVMAEPRRAVFLAIIVGCVGFLILAAAILWIALGVSEPIRRISERMNKSAQEVASAAGQVSSSGQSLAQGASDQAAAIEETSASLEEMSSMIKQNADHAGQADSLMHETKQVVSQANGSMKQLNTSMEEISRASEETSKIIKTIDEIAFQTNLLALNAAVEAARAGEAGAGFAVVADEVRNLAMRAADAAKNTATLIEETVKKVKDGADLTTKTALNFVQVEKSSEKVGELVGEISAASNEQAHGIDQTNEAVAEMDKVVQQNAANAEESASAGEQLNAQAEEMKFMVEELASMVTGSRKGLTALQG